MNDLERQLRTRLRQQEMVARLGLEVVTSPAFDQWLQTVPRAVSEALEADGAKVLELEASGRSFLLRAAHGIEPSYLGTYREQAGRASESGYSLLQKGPVISEDLRREARFDVPDILPRHGIVSTVTALIGDPAHPYGVLQIDSKTIRRFTDEDVHVAQAVANLVATAVDRQRARERLERSEQEQRALAELCSDYTYLIRMSPAGVPGLEWVSDSLLRETGFQAEELRREPQRLFGTGAEAHKLMAPMRSLEPGEKSHLEHEILTRDGKSRRVRNFFRRSPGNQAGGYFILGAALDVTERALLAEQLQQSQRLESVGRLAGGIAHDFNNLLTVITGYVDVLLAKRSPYDEGWDELTEIQRSADRAAGLTRQLLAYGRKQMMRPRVVRINAVVTQVERLLKRALGDDVSLVTALSDEAGEVLADPGQLEQVLLNLAMNARDAMPDGGTFTIATRAVEVGANAGNADGVRPGYYALLSATDTGHGMTPEVRERAFEPFFTTKSRACSSGLGLSSVYGIVAQSGGQIAVESQPEHGATFRVYLPRHRPDGARTPAAERPAVVVVEDDEPVRRLTARLLREAGFTVVEAGDGPSGLELIAQHCVDPAVVVTDIAMPGFGGPEMIQRAREHCPGLKVLFLSAHAEDALGGRLPPDAELLTKPFAPKELVSRLRAMLR